MHTSSVCKCNKIFDEETLHPLISVVNLGAKCDEESLPLDCYAVDLVTHPVGEGYYGHTDCDYTDAAMFFRLPDSLFHAVSGRQGTMLLFHPDLIRYTCLGQDIKDLTFFRYNADEALHLSACEARKMRQCLDDIEDELRWGVDEFTKALLCIKIEQLLNYACRFYHRQFIVRHDICAEQVGRVGRLIDSYFLDGYAVKGHLPKTQSLAMKMKMSDAYLNDLVKHETGVCVGEYISQRRILLAKTQLMGTNKSEQEISDMLGFCSVSCFGSLFKKLTGCDPGEYRG